MPDTTRIKLVYPAQGEREWFDTFVAFANALDDFLYGTKRNAILIPLFDASNFAWTVDEEGAGTLSWSGVAWYNPFTGEQVELTDGDTEVRDGEFVYVEITEGGGSGATVTLATSNLNPIDVQANVLVLGMRSGNDFWLANGVLGQKLTSET